MTSSGAAARDPGAERPQGGREGALMSIGEVLAHLRTEFPDTTISKLRFLEAEGLVDPQRTASGYRKYSWNDVARLRFVLTAQRDQYLPLRVIREQLDRMEQEPVVPQRPTLVAVGAQRATDPADARIPKDDLVERTGVDEAMLAELEQIGLVVARPPGWYDADAVIIVEAVVGLTHFGLEPRHLRAFKNAADREVGLFTQLLAPLARQQDPAARARATDTARELQALSQRLHAALVRTGLRGELGR
ncbi:MerR family transcriptional regulator [Actinoplanes sp. SE50]|nr:putative HTH-type transcriptional regulator [Actinoplanes sp. SE50/110]ATO84357.1 MerR family transcriptional regulator [Actinoplanes sp. SE50]SLM01767.1 MerR-family transcriptional regulator [Actinoplanes sp. SE50/110]